MPVHINSQCQPPIDNLNSEALGQGDAETHTIDVKRRGIPATSTPTMMQAMETAMETATEMHATSIPSCVNANHVDREDDASHVSCVDGGTSPSSSYCSYNVLSW